MTIIYRNNDPVSGRWSGIGADLSAFQIDSNFYECVSRISTLENNESFTVSISYITQTADTFTFHMTDHTLQGPFTIPQSTFRDRGMWQPGTPYLVNDTFNINGTLYLVIFAHTSQSTFSAGANDGLGHSYYSPMISTPGSALPTGGAVSQVLQKSSSTDFAVTWGYKLPTGGTTKQILAKVSNTNQDAGWEDFPGVLPPPPSPAGIPGQVLATVDGTHTNMEWIDAGSGSGGISAPPASPAASAGMVLATADGTDTHTEWLTALTGVDASGGFDGDQLRWSTSHDAWINREITQNDLGSTSGTYPIDCDGTPLTTVTPSNDIAFNNSMTGKVGQVTVIVITTTGTTSRNITFGSGYVGQGTLATGTVSGKKYVLSFMSGSDGTLYEMSRIGPF